MRYQTVLALFEDRARIPVGDVDRSWFEVLSRDFFARARIRRQRLEYLDLPFEMFPGQDEYMCFRSTKPKDRLPIIVFLTRSPATALHLSVSSIREWNGHRVYYRYRPECFATAEPAIGGSCVGPTGAKRGTIGGRLVSQSGESHFLSCGHVFPDRRDGTASIARPSSFQRAAARFGIPWLPRQLACTATVSMFAHRLGDVRGAGTSVDCAVLHTAEDIMINSAAGYIEPDHLVYQEHITFWGKSSGQVVGKIAGIMASHVVRINGQPVTCRNTLIIEPIFVGDKVAARGGDSGAWAVVQREGDPYWAAIVFSSDGDKTYCCLAMEVLDQLRRPIGVVTDAQPSNSGAGRHRLRRTGHESLVSTVPPPFQKRQPA
jgi:hypothetical protein